MRACNCARASPLQSRTRVGCDSMRNTFDIVSSQFQSTHPRGVRLNGKPSAREVKMVSIHAPAWGATGADGYGIPDQRVSIHAPAWGATPCSRPSPSSMGSFNPRTRVGCDTRATASLPTPRSFNPRTRVGCDITTRDIEAVVEKVSIHAPAWGATSGWGSAGSSPAMFQSTHPRGVRRGRQGAAALRPACFNPRTRVGCDVDGQSLSSSGARFQSTHPRGVRHERKLGIPRKELVSIHAPAWGATTDKLLILGQLWVSIHAPAWGATRV